MKRKNDYLILNQKVLSQYRKVVCYAYIGKALEMDELYGITQGYFKDMRTGVLNVKSLY